MGRKDLEKYSKVVLGLGIGLFVFIYFVVLVTNVEDVFEFHTYKNILRLTLGVSLISFCILSAIMSHNFIMKPYLYNQSDYQENTLFHRVVSMYSFLLASMLLCTVMPIGLFMLLESFMHFIPDTFTIQLSIEIIQMILVSIVSVCMIGMMSTGIGLLKKSSLMIFISTILLVPIYGNITINESQYTWMILVISTFIASILLYNTVSFNQRKEEKENGREENGRTHKESNQ